MATATRPVFGKKPDPSQTTTPNEFLVEFMRGCESIEACRLVAYIIRFTFGGQFDVKTYGPGAAELPGKRPLSLPLTTAQIAEACRSTESGAMKAKDYLEKLGVLKSGRDRGKLWYWVDLDSMKNLQPVEQRSQKGGEF